MPREKNTVVPFQKRGPETTSEERLGTGTTEEVLESPREPWKGLALQEVLDRLGSGGGGNGMEARIAKLESDVAHIQGDIKDIKQDFRDLRNTDLKDIRAHIRWAIGLGFLFGCGVLGAIARGFHWI